MALPAKPPTLRLDADLARAARQVSSLRGSVNVARFWGLVVLTFAGLVATRFHWAACVGAVFVIAKAQNSLMLLAHEAGHFLLFRESRRQRDRG